jgi:hypothetical protein
VATSQILMPSTSKSGDDYYVVLADLGPDLSGRSLGEQVRREVLGFDAKEVVFDCIGVDLMTPSFADEAFGKLALEDRRPRIRVVNATPDIVSTVRFAVRNRSAEREPVPA